MEESHSAAKKVLRKRDLLVSKAVCGFDLNDKIGEIVDCENEIALLDKQEGEDKLNVFRTFMSLLKPLFSERSKVIESIPNFWATVIEYHPKLTSRVTEDAVEVLKFLKNLEVDNIGTTYAKITLVFEENPFLENLVITKEFSRCGDNESVSASTPIKWKINPSQNKNKLGDGVCRKRKRENTNFFTWFCDGASRDRNLILNCFDEIWQNPLPFFHLGMMDSEVEDFEEMGNLMLDLDTNDDEDNVFGNYDSSSESINSCCTEYDDDDTEEEESDFGEEEDRDEDIDEDTDEQV